MKNPDEKPSRRKFLGAAGGTVAALALGDVARAQTKATTRVQGRNMTSLSERAATENPTRTVHEKLVGIATTPIAELDGIITPSDLHFTRHHAGIPTIAAESFELLVHGLVGRPTVFKLDDLRRLPARSMIRFLECAGNGVAGLRAIRRDLSPEAIDGATSNSEWTGVPLRTVLREVGVKPAARWILAQSQDAARYSRSIPLSKAQDDALLAYAQNGEPLRAEQGYPLRLLLPGWEGSASVKWLARLEVGDEPTLVREETVRYSNILPDGRVRVFESELGVKSIITFPAFPRQIAPGWWEIRGLAWSGRGRIARVEVSTDGGTRWSTAELDDPVLPKAHTRFRARWRWTGGTAVLVSRAVDESGAMQPSTQELRAERGPGNDYHNNNQRAWIVEGDGRVFFYPG